MPESEITYTIRSFYTKMLHANDLLAMMKKQDRIKIGIRFTDGAPYNYFASYAECQRYVQKEVQTDFLPENMLEILGSIKLKVESGETRYFTAQYENDMWGSETITLYVLMANQSFH